MKKFISAILAIACGAILVFGQLHWNEKTHVSTTNADALGETKGTNAGGNTSSASIESLLSYTKNWPVESVNTFKANVQEGKPFKIAFLGSNAQGNEEESWPQIVQAALTESYGEHIAVTAYSYNLTSTEYLNQNLQTELIKEQPDLVIFEPFTLKDNGIVEIGDSLENVSSIMNAVQTANPETVFILQPPHPLFNATFYPMQVEELRQYAQTNQIVYLNHWEAWPDPSTAEIKDYLAPDQSEPNAKGHELWAKYLLDYLIAAE